MKHFCRKLQNFLKKKDFKIKSKHFHELINKLNYSNIINIDGNNNNNQGENKKEKENEKNKNKDKKVHNTENIKEDYLTLYHYENYLMKNRLRNIFLSISNNINNKIKSLRLKYFSKWVNISSLNIITNKFKSEQEKKIIGKYESKISDENKTIKKLEKEKVELSIKNDSLLQSIQVYTLKINSFNEKEKNLINKVKTLENEKKKNLIDLQKNEANIDKKIENIELEIKNFDNKIEHLKDIKIEKDTMINSYIEDMNYVLDIYEVKISN
jgi:hypothetical protein